MPPRRRRYSSPARKRNYAWESSRFAPTTVGEGLQVSASLLADPVTNTVSALVRQAFTVVRIIGELKVVSAAAGFDVEWAAGISVINKDAFAANVLPEPATDTAQKWMWWKARTSPPSDENFAFMELDIKAKRKLSSEDELFFVIDNLDMDDDLEFSLSTRVLVSW